MLTVVQKLFGFRKYRAYHFSDFYITKIGSTYIDAHLEEFESEWEKQKLFECSSFW